MTKSENNVKHTTVSPVLEVCNVSNTYSNGVGLFRKKQDKNVLKDVSLVVNSSEIVGLVGESGCGKTTLGRAILGLIPFRGNILIEGKSRGEASRIEDARLTQAVFQDPTGSLNPAKRVGWLLEESLRVHKIGTVDERNRRVAELLDLVGLDASYSKRRISELSGGQKQRVAIGMALSLTPKLIIADEIVSALDVSVGAQILNLLSDLHNRLGLSLLFISHNLDVVYYLCDRIAVMRNGEIVEVGTAADVYIKPRHEYTKQLLAAVPKIRS